VFVGEHFLFDVIGKR